MKISKRTLLKTVVLCGGFLIITCQSRSAAPGFKKDIAFEYLKKQVAFGPRFPGSPAHIQVRDYLISELRKFKANVRTQSFPVVNFMQNKRAQGYNIIASFGGQNPELILCAHWDSRPLADQDPNPANRSKPVPAANDGASGVAILLEVARNLQLQPPPFPVQIIFFDAEDMGRSSHNEEFLQGSRFFSKNLSYSFHPKAAILLDMVGDRDLQLPIEQNSLNYASNLVNRVWSIAEQLGITAFTRDTQPPITDDHIPLLNAGIPAIDIIDFDYPYWHTIEDTPDKCSPESLEKVGRVLLTYIYGQVN